MFTLLAAATLAASLHNPVVVGHRAHETADENTLQALRFDAKHGVQFETDTWVTEDGVSIIVHDSDGCRTIDHSTYPPGVACTTKWRDLTYAQVEQMRTKLGHKIPTIWDWIEVAGRRQVAGMIEVKWIPHNPAGVMRYVRMFNAPVSFYLTPKSYNGKCIQASAQKMRDAGAVIGLKMTGPCADAVSLRDAATFGYSYVIGRIGEPGFIDTAHSLGLKVGNFNSGRPKTWRQLRDMGADYILTPTPVATKRWLASHR
jgi:glycerophosphoryl diester phosphodiesterase